MSRQTTLGRFGFKETEHFAQKLRDGNESLYPIFFSTASRTIKCNHCSKLFVNQQGLFYTVKLLHSQMFQHKNLILIVFKISASALFFKYSSNFANFSLDILIKYILTKKTNKQTKHICT